MKFYGINIVCMSVILLAVTSCSGSQMPHIVGTNEVPQSVMEEPRLIETPVPGEALKQPWMRLGDVPSMPKDFTSAMLIDQTRQQMIDQRNQAGVLKQAADNPVPAEQQ